MRGVGGQKFGWLSLVRLTHVDPQVDAFARVKPGFCHQLQAVHVSFALLHAAEWHQHGGKWLIFDRQEKLLALAHKLESFIDSGDIHSAKSWNGDPSALNVYSLDKNREKVKKIVESCGAKRQKVWEYDYAWRKNVNRPIDFIYSRVSKFTTILKSYGIRGTIQLFKELVKPN